MGRSTSHFDCAGEQGPSDLAYCSRASWPGLGICLHLRYILISSMLILKVYCTDKYLSTHADNMWWTHYQNSIRRGYWKNWAICIMPQQSHPPVRIALLAFIILVLWIFLLLFGPALAIPCVNRRVLQHEQVPFPSLSFSLILWVVHMTQSLNLWTINESGPWENIFFDLTASPTA